MATELTSNELVKFFYGTQEFYDDLVANHAITPVPANYLYFITDTKRIYKGLDLVSGDVDVFYDANGEGSDEFISIFDLESDELKPIYDKKLVVYEYTNVDALNSYFNSLYNHTGSDANTTKYNAWVRGKDGKLHQLITPTSPIEAMKRMEMNTIDYPIADSTGSLVGTTAVKSYTQLERSKLSGIEYGAEVNVQADWEETNSSSDAFIVHRPPVSDDLSHPEHDAAPNSYRLPTVQAVNTELLNYVNSPEDLYIYYTAMNAEVDPEWAPNKEVWVPLTQLNSNWLTGLESWYRAHIENVASGSYPSDFTQHSNIVYSIKGPGTAENAYTGDVTFTRADMQIEYVPNIQPMLGFYSNAANPTGVSTDGAVRTNHFITFADNDAYTPADSGISVNTLNARFEGGTGTVDGITYNYPGKVDKVEGYALSKNDFTDELKAELDNLWERLPLDKSTTATTDRNTLYTLPIATSDTLGGIEIGSDLSIDSSTGRTNLVTQDNVVPETYGNSSMTLDTSHTFNIPQVTVNSKGVITNISNQEISFTTNANPTAGTYGSETSTLSHNASIEIPRVEVDGNGYVTGISSQTISFSTLATPTAGTYGSESTAFGVGTPFSIPRVTVDANGYVTDVSNQEITLGTLPTATTVTPGVVIVGSDLNINESILNLATQTNVVPGIYGNDTQTLTYNDSIRLPQITVNSKGVITKIENKIISFDTLATTTAGTYGSSSTTLGYGASNKISIPQVTVDAKGIITNITSQDIDFNTFKGIDELSIALDNNHWTIIGVPENDGSVTPYKVKLGTLASYIQNYQPTPGDTLITKDMLENNYLPHYLKRDEDDSVIDGSVISFT